MKNIGSLTVKNLMDGFCLDPNQERYQCILCQREFEAGEIYKLGDRLFEASCAVRHHVREEHGDMLEVLTSMGKRYTGLTDNQKELLLMLSEGLADADIAEKTGTAASTVRHQRFVLREKAVQAKLYLSVYELAMRGKEEKAPARAEREEEFVEVHAGATMVDDRYRVTKAEQEEIIAGMFSSLRPLKLKSLSPKEKKKIVILRKIIEEFDRGRRYTEKEVNTILEGIYDDYATIRRYLIEYGFMDRTRDCREYWLK